MTSPIPRLTDCHAHLGDPVFDADRDQMLARARAAGVGAVITVGESLEDAERILRLAAEYPEIRPAAGLFPTRLDLEEASRVEAFIREHRTHLAAIGEVGLDPWKVQDPEGRKIQREIFLRFVALSDELDLPLNVHSRSAGREVVSLLIEHRARRVQLHAFDGKASSAAPGVEAGFFFSIPPCVVRSEQKQRLVRHLPLSCLLLETDSPVLGPTPGERNEPANLVVSLRAIAELKGIGEREVTDAVSANARRLYRNLAP